MVQHIHQMLEQVPSFYGDTFFGTTFWWNVAANFSTVYKILFKIPDIVNITLINDYMYFISHTECNIKNRAFQFNLFLKFLKYYLYKIQKFILNNY